jgi:putative membrane protein
MADPHSPAAMLKPWIGAAVLMAVFGGALAFVEVGTRLLWLKSFHVIAVVAWFAGIFYLPRLFVYHAMVDDDDERGHERFLVMERKLYRFITPFMVLTVFFGTWMIVDYGLVFLTSSHWLHAKLLLVTGLVGYHFWLGSVARGIAKGNKRGHVFYRVINELPVLVLFAVVILVIVKPF